MFSYSDIAKVFDSIPLGAKIVTSMAAAEPEH
jgi:hypothetical protein